MSNSAGKYLSEVINLETDILPYHLIQIISGVGSGKNTWVSTLAQKGYSILFITSRKATAEAQSAKMGAKRFIDLNDLIRTTLAGTPTKNKQHLVSCTNSALASFVRKTYDKDNPATHIWKYFDFIVVDEAHSLVSDASFADSTFYVWKFIDWVTEITSKEDCRIILMSGTPAPLELPLSKLKERISQKKGHDTQEFKDIDCYANCRHVDPKEVIIDLANDIAIHEIIGFYKEGHRLIYFACSIHNIASLVKQLNEYGIKNSEIGISYSDRTRDKLFPKELTQKIDNIQDSIVKEDRLPSDIKIFLTTTKNKEGINILDTDIKIMLSENSIPTELIQMAGRVRNGLDKLVILFKHGLHGDDDMDNWYRYRDHALCANIFETLKKYATQYHKPSYKEIIRDTEDTFPNIRYDYFREELLLFEGVVQGNDFTQCSNDLTNESINFWNSLYYLDGQETTGQAEFQRNFFPYSDVNISYPGLHDRLQPPNVIKQNIVDKYLQEKNAIGRELTDIEWNTILKDLHELLKDYTANANIPKSLSPLLKKYGYSTKTYGKHEKGKQKHIITKEELNESGRGEK